MESVNYVLERMERLGAQRATKLVKLVRKTIMERFPMNKYFNYDEFERDFLEVFLNCFSETTLGWNRVAPLDHAHSDWDCIGEIGNKHYEPALICLYRAFFPDCYHESDKNVSSYQFGSINSMEETSATVPAMLGYFHFYLQILCLNSMNPLSEDLHAHVSSFLFDYPAKEYNFEGKYLTQNAWRKQYRASHEKKST